MKKIFSAFFIIIFCLFSAPAAEPVLVGTAEMPSMTSFLNSSAPFLEKLSQGLSAKLLLAATALAFAPDLKDFDITQPAALYIYAMPGSKTPEPATVIVISKKSDLIPPQMQITGQQLYTKTFGNKVMLSESKSILDAIAKLPEPMKIEDNQIKVFVRPADFIKNFPEDFQEFRRGIVKQIASSGKRRLDVNGIKVLNLKLAYIEKAIEQIDSISLTISADKEILNLALSLNAKKDSALAQFITAQEKATATFPEPQPDKLISASGHVEMTEPFRKALSDMVEGIAVEEADDESQMKYVSTLQLLFKTFQGTFSFYMDTLAPENNKRFTVTTLQMQDPKAAESILKSLSETSKKIDDNTYSMTSVFVGPQTESKLIGFVDGQNVKMLSGVLSEKEASEQFENSRKNKLQMLTGNSCSALIGKDNPSKAKIDFKNSNMLLSLALTPETLRPVLPENTILNPSGSPQKPGQKKKKQRIHIKPSDFMKGK